MTTARTDDERVFREAAQSAQVAWARADYYAGLSQLGMADGWADVAIAYDVTADQAAWRICQRLDAML